MKHNRIGGSKRIENPIVALESTIIAHGMPYPQNIETSKNDEEIIRERGGSGSRSSS